MRLRLLDALSDHATRSPDAPAVRHVTAAALPSVPDTVTYRALAALVSGMAARLSRDVAAGEVVLVACPNDARFTATFLAVLAAGTKAFPVSPELTEPELQSAAEQSAAVAVVGSDSVLAALRGKVRTRVPIAEVSSLPGGAGIPSGRDPGGGGLLLQSSGTTGKPKIAFRSAASLDAVAAAMVEAIGFAPADRVLLPLPLCHSYGIEHGLLAPVMAGSCVHLCRGFDLHVVLNELTAGGVTIFPGVPFMFESLARLGGGGASAASATASSPSPGTPGEGRGEGLQESAIKNQKSKIPNALAPALSRSTGRGSEALAPPATPALPTLRRAYSAGGPLPRGVFDAFRERYGVPVAQIYGATEIGSVMFNDPGAPGDFDPASVGRAMRGVDVRILDVEKPRADRPLPAGTEGQVAVRADSMMSGYLGDDAVAAPTTVDGYFLTGDLGRMDPRGRLTLTGRIKLLIDVGGLKVNPLEVEAVLMQHPEVAACVVLPVRVSDTVCRLKAVVQPRDPDGPGPTAESLRRFARARLTPYKVPRVFEVRRTLPRSPTGKILRHLVAA